VAGFVDGPSMDRNERARIVRAPLRAGPPPARRAARGPRWKSGALLRASKSRSIAVPTRAGVALLWERRKPRCSRFQVPFGAGGRRSIRPKGARDGSRAFAAMQGCIVGEPRPTFTHLPRSGRRRCGGVLLFGFFLLDKQEKETGPQGCGTNPHGCDPVFAIELPTTTAWLKRTPCPNAGEGGRERANSRAAIHADLARARAGCACCARRARSQSDNRSKYR